MTTDQILLAGGYDRPEGAAGQWFDVGARLASLKNRGPAQRALEGIASWWRSRCYDYAEDVEMAFGYETEDAFPQGLVWDWLSEADFEARIAPLVKWLDLQPARDLVGRRGERLVRAFGIPRPPVRVAIGEWRHAPLYSTIEIPVDRFQVEAWLAEDTEQERELDAFNDLVDRVAWEMESLLRTQPHERLSVRIAVWVEELRRSLS